MKSPDEKIIMNAAECGEYLGKRSAGAVRNLVMRRKIPFRKVGGRLVFLKNEINEWVLTAPGVKLEDLKNEQ